MLPIIIMTRDCIFSPEGSSLEKLVRLGDFGVEEDGEEYVPITRTTAAPTEATIWFRPHPINLVLLMTIL